MSKRSVSIPLHLQISASGLPQPVQEYRFAPPRRWRFDYAWPASGLACEVEGGVWVKGRHTRGTGYEKDCEKYNEAVLRGWRVLRVTTGMVQRGEALTAIKAALGR